MTFNYSQVLDWQFEPVRQTIEPRNCILYALSVGLCRSPNDEQELPFVYERRLRVLPTMAAVLATPGFWVADRRTGIDLQNIFHSEQAITWRRPIPVGEEVIGESYVVDIIDKGPGRGAMIIVECAVRNRAGQLIWTVRRSAFVRGAGGFGGTVDQQPRPTLPTRECDVTCVLPTTGQQALLYRLNGDDNPLHVDPAVARKAGFELPILHGLCTFGIAGHAVLRTLCDYDEQSLQSLEVRFSSPVFPGETIATDFWRAGAKEALIRCRVVERDTTVVSYGRVLFK
jgi:acyl dehydratase